jgi:hypothetical protein
VVWEELISLDRESEESVRYEEANGWQAAASLRPTSKTKL